jgi:tetratricopeptide (TPR) repeat protein
MNIRGPEQCWRALQLVLIVLAGALAYSHSLHGQFVLDDHVIISGYGPKRIPELLYSGGFRRVVNATFAINYQLHGFQVTGYHLVNISIHILSALSAYFISVSAVAALRISFPSQQRNQAVSIERFVPLTVGLFFVLHPVQTQAVTYIVQRYTSLATLFYLFSVLMFIRARLTIENKRGWRCTLVPALATLSSGLLALGCKEIAVTLPVMLLFLELFLFRGRLLTRRLLSICGILAVLTLAVIFLAGSDHTLQGFIGTLNRATAENHYFSRSSYFLTELRVMATYLRLLCLPIGQSLFHDQATYTSILALPVMASLLLHLALISIASLLYWHSGRRITEHDTTPAHLQRLASLGIVWFYCTMAVESSIFPITDTIFEHRMYLPSFGFFLAIAAGGAWLFYRYNTSGRSAWSLLFLFCIVLGVLTVSRNQIWGDTLLLWQDTARKAPHKDLALANLAGEYMKRDQPEKALPLFVRALELNPDFHPRTKIYLGRTLQRLGIDTVRFTTGEELLQNGDEQLKPGNERRLVCVLQNNLALSYEIMGKPEKALKAYRAALQADRNYEPAWYNLGLFALGHGDKNQADAALLWLKAHNPSLAESFANTMAAPR